jgi:lipoprotein-anchoring transpeptidase ErfK/SrfK
VWNVPDSDWAGDMAGKVIPGGDPQNPLVARWIGFNGSVGFHGTKSIDSLGRSASHGCVRMAPADVIDLYQRVEVGTPVVVA